MLTAQVIIDHFHMKPLTEEGGYFVETYRSPLSTAIYYLLTADTFSAMHRLPGDEIFHFYLGDPVEMLELTKNGNGQVIILGNTSLTMHPQTIVPGGTWQGSHLIAGGKFALLGTTMAPPFVFSEFESGKRRELLEEYPAFADLITMLTF